MSSALLQQLALLAAPKQFSTSAAARLTQNALLAATIGPAASGTPVNQFANLVAYSTERASSTDKTVPMLHQLPVLVAFKTGTPEDNDFRSWFFDLDGHTFYVLVLGQIGTFLYDFTTQTWSQFVTEGQVVWNAEIGVVRNGQIFAADVINPIIWEVTPELFTDEEFKPIRRTVTAITPARNRVAQQVGAIRVYASSGAAQEPNSGVDATMTLSYSDDQGQTYTEFASIEISEALTQEYAFRSLGAVQQPGRVWRIEDVGGPVRIDDAQIDLLGDENG